MNRMLYLRDLDVDVLIRCRACGHEGVLPHAEAMRRFGASYPVLSIAPHYRCSACNARDAESLAAPAPEPLYATPVDHHDEQEDDGGFAAALASLQNLVEAAHASPAAAKRKAVPEPEPELPPPPINAVWDEDEEAAARAAWDAEPVWTPPPAALRDDADDEPPPRRRRDTPALPDKPFFASRERGRRAPEPPPVAALADDDDDDYVREEPKRDPADVPLSAMPILSLADIKALLGEEASEETNDDTGAAPLDGDAQAGVAEEAAPDPVDDEDDPLLSSALQRLLRNAPVEVEDEDAEAETKPDQADYAASEPIEAPEPDAAAAPFAERYAQPDDAEEELSDDELISFAIGDRDAATPRDVTDALPPEMAALLADDEDEVYEYAPDEILDVAPEQQPPEQPPSDDDAPDEVPVAPVLSASDDDIADIDIAEIVDFAASSADPPDTDAGETEIAETDLVDDEPLLLDDEARVAAAAPEQDEDEDPDLAALRALLAETEDRDHADDLDVDDLALDDLATSRPAANATQGGVSAERGFERPPRDSLINDGDNADAAPPAWRTQRPPPGPDEEGGEGMEDALATLRALIEQAAAEPEDDASTGERAPAPVQPPPQADEDDDLNEETISPPPAFAARIDDDEDDPEAWAALMREVAAKAAGDDGDDTLPLTPAPLTPAPLTSAPLSPAQPASPSVPLSVSVPSPDRLPSTDQRSEEKPAGKRGASLDDTLTRLRGLLDLPQDEPPRGRGRRR